MQKRYGVFYPLQTFSKNKKVNFSNIPFFVEANSEKDATLLTDMALKISQDVRVISSEQRKYIHLAAVLHVISQTTCMQYPRNY